MGKVLELIDTHTYLLNAGVLNLKFFVMGIKDIRYLSFLDFG